MLQQHPWIFSGALESLPEAQEGDIVRVISRDKGPIGYGFYSSRSQISCRMFAFSQKELVLEADFWHAKLAQALEIRQNWVNSPQTNAYRLIHAEGDFFPGLIADVYGPVVVLQLLIQGTERILPHIRSGLEGLGFEHIYLRTKESSRRLEDLGLESAWLGTPADTPLPILENNYIFAIDVEKGQKTGFFLDQRDNRRLLEHYAKGKKVLNAFSYSAGFSVYALGGRAQSVDSVDISAEAIALGDQNVEMNFDRPVKHRSFTEDCFEYLKKTDETYDIIVLDPPAFAKNKRAVANASRGYISLNELGLKRLRPGGMLFTFSCSGSIDRDVFRKIVFTAAAQVKRPVRILHQLTQPLDHPVNIYHPEGEYLKGLVLHAT